MKKLLVFTLIFVSLLTLSCKKDNKNSGNNPNYPNVVKLTIDGKEYISAGRRATVSEDYAYIESDLKKSTDGSWFYIFINRGKTDFYLDLSTKNGPANGLGSYELKTGSLVGKYSGGEAYNILGGTLVITKSEPKLIEGTISMQVKGASSTKTVTGSFKIADPLNM
jgi:hypothetical protein